MNTGFIEKKGLVSSRNPPEFESPRTESMLPRTLIRKVTLLAFLCISKGYMGQVHPNSINLEDMTKRANGIFLVQRTSPFNRTQKIEADESGKHPPYESYREVFKIVRIIKNKSRSQVGDGDTIEVRAAYDALMLYLHRLHYLEGRDKSPILDFYDQNPSAIGKMKRLLIFVSYDDKDGSFSYCVNGATENEAKLEEVMELAMRPDKPVFPKPN